MICRTCETQFNKTDRHLDCSKCRSVKNIKNKRQRTCITCSKIFIGTKNMCSACKFQKDCKVIKYRNCSMCNKQHKRPGSTCAVCNRQKYKESYTDYGNLHSDEKRLKHKKASLGGIYSKQVVEIYRNCPEGHDVDHIIPLKNKDVCGLHIPDNLQYLESKNNNYKRNKFDFTNSNESWKRGK